MARVIGNLDFNNVGRVLNITAPVSGGDATNKWYVDSLVASSSGAETLEQILIKGNSAGTNQIDMNLNKIINLGTPGADADAATKGYVDTVAAISSGKHHYELVGSQGASGSTVFILPSIYAVGQNDLSVYCNGILLRKDDDYFETDATTITTVLSRSANDKLTFKWGALYGVYSTTQTFIATISSPITTWVVNHNLNSRPVIVQTYSTSWSQIFGDVVLTTANQAQISFSSAQTGAVIVKA